MSDERGNRSIVRRHAQGPEERQVFADLFGDPDVLVRFYSDRMICPDCLGITFSGRHPDCPTCRSTGQVRIQ